jgi:hypothetical protein
MVRILSDADVMLQVQAEVSAALTSSGGIFSLEMLQQLPYLSNCIKVILHSRVCLESFSPLIPISYNAGISAFAC